MKRSFFVFIILVCVSLSSCRAQVQENYEKDMQTINEAAGKITSYFAGYEVPFSAAVDEQTLKELFYVEPDDVICYTGFYSRAINSADNIVVIHAKEGAADRVESALKQRRQDVMQNFENYLPEQYQKAQDGQVVRKGNRIALIMLGNTEENSKEQCKNAADAFLSFVS